MKPIAPVGAISFPSLMRSLITAKAVDIFESFCDIARQESSYAAWVEQDYIRVLPEDRGDGIGRIRIEPTVKGRDARDSRDWWAR